MAKQFTKKPVTITAYTFAEFLEYGKLNAPVDSKLSEGGNPWHFEFHGIPVTQETDSCYLASTKDHGSLRFTVSDMIIIGTQPGDIYPCNIETFKTLFDEVETVEGYEPHQVRVVLEYRALVLNIEKLSTFFETEFFKNNLDVNEQMRMKIQKVHMESYASVLWDRINAFTGDVPRPLTFGEKAMGITFNHGKGEIAWQIHYAKMLMAESADLMHNLRSHADPGEYAALCTIAIRDLQKSQMMMVKAITWRDEN